MNKKSRDRNGLWSLVVGLSITVIAFHVGVWVSTWPHASGYEIRIICFFWAVMGAIISIPGANYLLHEWEHDLERYECQRAQKEKEEDDKIPE